MYVSLSLSLSLSIYIYIYIYIQDFDGAASRAEKSVACGMSCLRGLVVLLLWPAVRHLPGKWCAAASAGTMQSMLFL